jgi:putative PIN family toxin of toxin-antitoxin system
VRADKAKPRLVLDTNVFVSGLISATGFPARILHIIRENRAVHLVSDPIVEEYLRILSYPRMSNFKNVTDAFIAEIAAYLSYRTERVELVSITRLSPDPDDNVFLETAIDGYASLIVSGDRAHMLSLREVEGIPIVSAREAAQRLGIGS